MRLLLVPGFTQTAASWDGVRAALDHDGLLEPVTLDVPQRASFAETVDALATAGGRGVWCGYSMGGRLALALALAHPELVEKLVLVSATPGTTDPVARQARIDADEELACAIERDDTFAFLERWLAQPMFADVPPDAPGIADRAGWSADALAHTLRTLGTGTMPNMWERLGELAMPVLVVTGAADVKFTAIGDAMAAHIHDVWRVRVPCGHAVPLVCPGELATLLQVFTSAPASSTDTAS